MTKLKLGVILCLLFSSSYAQKAKITLGEFDKFKGELVANIHTFGENEAYDVSVNNSLLASTGQRKMNIMMRHSKQ